MSADEAVDLAFVVVKLPLPNPLCVQDLFSHYLLFFDYLRIHPSMELKVPAANG